MDVVLLDTNIIISALINPRGSPAKLLTHWKTGRFNICISEPLFEEFKEVIRRPRIKEKYGITDSEIKELENIIVDKAIFVAALGSIKLCRDPDDDMVLETAIVSRAHYLITGDKDLKSQDLVTQLDKNGVRILTVNQYLKLPSQREP